MRKLALFAAAAVLFAAASARASTPQVALDPTQFNIQVPGSFSATAATLTHGNETATGGFTPGGPFVSAAGSDAGQNSSATAQWEIKVTGGGPGDVIPIIITGSFSANSTGGGAAGGGLAFGDFDFPLTYLAQYSCAGGVGDCGPQGFVLHTLVSANSLYSILIGAGGSVSSAGGSYTATLDPMASFDLSANFDFSPFTLHVSPDAVGGGGNGGIPEPASWALMILGFGAVGASLRSRRPVAA